MHSLLTLSLLLVGTAAYYDTVLEKKCMALKRTCDSASYVEGICFVALREKVNTTRDTWNNLHQHCRMINGYKGHLATIPNRDMLVKIQVSGATKPGNKYFIGAKQDPIPVCPGTVCSGKDQAQNWFFFDENNKQLIGVSNETWIIGEPGNTEVYETIALLESIGDVYLSGLNDVVPEKALAQPLCQYVDYLDCTDGYILIRDRCYKIHSDAKNAASAKSTCENEGGLLASIHDDAMNAIIIDYSRTRLATPITLPIRFGLKYGSTWANDDATPSDYFRWYKEEGCGKPTVFKNGGVGAALGVNAASRDPDVSYWKIVKDSDNLPFLCSKNPTSRYTSA